MRLLLALPLMLATAAVAAGTDETWIRYSDVGLNAVHRETHETYTLAPRAGVEVERIGGNVRVTGADIDHVELDYRRRGASQHDLDCETLRVDNGATLSIRVEPVRESNCHMIAASDDLTLRVPRATAVALQQIGDSVHVSGVTGMVQLESVGDSAVLEGVTQLRANSIGDRLRIDTAVLAPAGLRIDSVGDTVELHLPSSLGAHLRIGSVGGRVRGVDRRRDRDDDDDDEHEGADVKLAGGGPDIEIDSVGDDVVISR